MFKIFKKKSKLDKLGEQYRKLLKEAHKISTIDRRASDAKFVEAQLILNEIDKIKRV